MTHLIRLGDLSVDIGDTTAARARVLVAARDRMLGQVDARDDAPGPATRPVLLARIGTVILAFPLMAVAGVIATPRTHRVPGAPKQHRGLFVHNGATVNLLAIDAALGLEADGGDTVLLLAGTTARVALAVDEAIGLGQSLGPVDDDGIALAPPAAMASGGDLPLVNVSRLLATLRQDGSSEGEFDA